MPTDEFVRNNSVCHGALQLVGHFLGHGIKVHRPFSVLKGNTLEASNFRMFFLIFEKLGVSNRSGCRFCKEFQRFFSMIFRIPFENGPNLMKSEMVFPLLVPSLNAFMRKRFSAFTILEIMVVVALMGLLTAIVTPHLLSARNRANQKVCLNNLRQIDQAIQIWAAEVKALPTDVVTHTNLIPYLGTLPTCPAVRRGTFFSDYGMTFVQEPAFCIANVSFASAPHSLNPIASSPIAAGDARPSANISKENFPKPRRGN